MRVQTWNLLLLYLLLSCAVQCQGVPFCNSLVSINCSDYFITIKNATASIVPNLLKQCSARQECKVPIGNKECVHADYWCRQDISSLETKKSSLMHIKIKQAGIGLMSEGYINGIYQRAENINCNVTFSWRGNQMKKEVKFMFNEFTSLTNSTEICLRVDDSMVHPFCSGSQKYYASYGPFDMTNRGEFSFTLASAVKKTETPQVRFWFDIYVSSGAQLDHMECLSKPVSAGPTPATDSTRPSDNNQASSSAVATITSAMLGSFLIAITVAFTIVIVMWRWQHKFLCWSKNSDKDNYSYISMDSPGTWDSRRSEVPLNIVRAIKDAETISQVSEGKRGAMTRQDKLPTNSELPKADCGFREEPADQRGPEILLEVQNKAISEPTEDLQEYDDCHAPQDNKGAISETETSEHSTSQEYRDYLVLIGDPQDPKKDAKSCGNQEDDHQNDSDTSKVNEDSPQEYLQPVADPENLQENQIDNVCVVNEYSSLNATEESVGQMSNNIERPYTPLGKAKCSGAAEKVMVKDCTDHEEYESMDAEICACFAEDQTMENNVLPKDDNCSELTENPKDFKPIEAQIQN